MKGVYKWKEAIDHIIESLSIFKLNELHYRILLWFGSFSYHWILKKQTWRDRVRFYII